MTTRKAHLEPGVRTRTDWDVGYEAGLAAGPMTEDAEMIAAAMNEAYTYEDDDHGVPTLPFVDDAENFWDPFGVKVAAVIASEAAPTPMCSPGCGSLQWTVEQWGRVTHKHSCPNRTDPWCQTHPTGCEAAPVVGLDTDALTMAVHKTRPSNDAPEFLMDAAKSRAERIAAEYARLTQTRTLGTDG